MTVHASGPSNVAVYPCRVQPKSAIQRRVKGAAGIVAGSTKSMESTVSQPVPVRACLEEVSICSLDIVVRDASLESLSTSNLQTTDVVGTSRYYIDNAEGKIVNIIEGVSQREDE